MNPSGAFKFIPEFLAAFSLQDSQSCCFGGKIQSNFLMVIDHAITFPFLFQVTTTAPPPPASIVLVAGGNGNGYGDSRYFSEIIAENVSDQRALPYLPEGTDYSGASLLNHNNTILYCVRKYCLQLKLGSLTSIWAHHSNLNKHRTYSSGVSTNSASFLFGGYTSSSEDTYEYMEFGSNVWKNGQTSLPMTYEGGCGVAVSNEKILLIGGDTGNSYKSDTRIWSFDTLTHTITQLPIYLKQRRRDHACIRIPNTEKVLVTGGMSYNSGWHRINSAEIIDISTQSVTYTGSMNSARNAHGMGIMTIGNVDKIITFGGYYKKSLDTIEVFHEDTQSWEMLSTRLSKPKSHFGYLSIMNTGDTLLTFPTHWTNTNSFVIIYSYRNA